MRDMAQIIQLSGLISDDPYILVGYFSTLVDLPSRQIVKYPHYKQMRDMAQIIQLSRLSSDDPYILVGYFSTLV